MNKYRFGKKSMKKLSTCDVSLQELNHMVMSYQVMDFTIVWGYRTKKQQNAMFDQVPPVTTKEYPDSRHNFTLDGLPNSLAIDAAPWINGKIPWNDTDMFCVMIGMFFVASKELEIEIRSGIDWDRDFISTDQTLMDYAHIELVV